MLALATFYVTLRTKLLRFRLLTDYQVINIRCRKTDQSREEMSVCSLSAASITSHRPSQKQKQKFRPAYLLCFEEDTVESM
jgi:hypothetical protein